MKRTGNLISLIADPDNMRLAFWKAQKGKTGNKDVNLFRKNLDRNLIKLRQQVISGDIEVGNYHYFTIYDPKERQICAASFPERVLHHALMNVCHPVFERYQIFDSYACRKGKGTYAALERAHSFQKKYKWYLKLDIRKFFDSINQNVLLKVLERLFKDKKLIDAFVKIIDSYQVTSDHGIPIGNLTSQYFANHLLAFADHFVKEKLQVPGYVRYMDDMVLWHSDKSKLLEAGRIFETFIKEELKLVLKPFCLNRVDKGLPFLGYLVFPSKTLLAKRSRIRYASKLKKYCNHLETGDWSQEIFQQHIQPLVAFTEHGNGKGFRKKILSKISGQWPWALTA